jgi:hypothetical protein
MQQSPQANHTAIAACDAAWKAGRNIDRQRDRE